MRIIFIRHGETQVNTKKKIHRTDDPAVLTQLGTKQIIKTIPLLKRNNAEKIYCSPERRAHQSAIFLAQKLHLPLTIILGFGERRWGDWEGRSWNEIEKKLNHFSLNKRYTFTPPQGESWQQMEKRLMRALRKIIAGDKQNVVIVTHAGALRGLIPILKKEPKSNSLNYDFKNGSITIFDYKNRKFKEVVTNDISHLRTI